MARPRKQTVDYFPHDTDASDSRTLTILEHKFGNDGYAFWFKLLEVLGRTRGHYYVYNDNDSMEFLLAKTKIKDTETALAILDTLATRGSIDKELHGHKIIWSQNFVSGIADVYARRKEPLPGKPDWRVIEGIKDISVDENSVNDNRSTQSKLNETKVNETIMIDDDKSSADSKEIAEVLGEYERDIGKVTPGVEEELRAVCSLYPPAWVKEAIREAIKTGPKAKNLRYITGTLQNLAKERGKGDGARAAIKEISAEKLIQNPVAVEIWKKALEELEEQVTRSYYRTWLEKTAGIEYKDSQFTVGVPNAFIAEYLNQNQRSLIEKVLIGHTGPEISLSFVVVKGGDV
jgi:hypothetical protein